MTTFTLRCLGAFAVSLGTTPITAFATGKTRALLAYLALEAHHAHARPELLGLLWPEITQEAAQNSLRVTLYRLRETLEQVQAGAGETLIHSTRQTVQCNPQVVTVDVLTFEQLLAACAAHAHADLQQCDDCLARLKAAADLYGGELLTGLDLADAPAFEEWLLLRRESLHQQALAAFQQLVQGYEGRGDDAQAHHYASRQLALDPSREEAHRQLMRILARRGLRSEALAQYETCRRILQGELGVEPELETVALYEQIRAGKLDKETLALSAVEGRWQGDKVTSRPEGTRSVTLSPLHPATLSPGQDWSEAPETGKVYGRESEQAQLQRWLTQEACRVVALLGIGGLGKTTLAATAVRAVAAHFDRLLWRSLLNAPPLDELLRDILQRLADERLPDFPATLDAQLALLLEFLRQQRILLVLDNLESILQPDQPGQMRTGYEGYAQLLRLVAERSHQSCLLLTSRERPQGLEQWAEDSPQVRILPLEGLTDSAGHAMLTARGLTGPAADATALVARYSGNPLALKLVAQTVQELFAGDIAAFLAVEAPIFDDIRLVLDQQFARLSPLEQELLLWLAVERAPVTAATLRANLVQPPPMPRFLEALRALQRRSLLENVGQGFTLQNVVIEYLTERLVERVCEEVATSTEYGRRKAEENSAFRTSYSALNRHALLKAQATQAIRQSQARLLLQPVIDRLLARVSKAQLATQIEWLLTTLRHTAPLAPGYVGGNLFNLLLALGINVSNYDFSHLCLWQAYLRDAHLPRVNLTNADLSGAAFTHRIGTVQALHFNQANELLIVAFNAGVLGLWRARTGELVQQITVDPQLFHEAFLHNKGRFMAQRTIHERIVLVDLADNQVLHTLTGDPSSVWRIAFSPNGRYVASGHSSGWICVWEVVSGRLCAQWQAHDSAVTALAFAPDNEQLASGAVNAVASLWHATTGTLIHTLRGHRDEVTTLGFTPSGAQLITGSHDLSVRLWETASGALLAVLEGHTKLVRKLVISPNGRWLATGGADSFFYLWELPVGKIHQILADHAASIDRIDFSPDSQTLATQDVNTTISIWDVASGQRLESYRLHQAVTYALAFSPDGRWLATGGADTAVYLWDLGQPAQAHVIARWVGHRHLVRALAYSPDGTMIASADYSGGLHLWHISNATNLNGTNLNGTNPTGTSQPRASRKLLGTQAPITQIAFSTDGQTLAGTSEDGLLLWSVATGRQTHVLLGATQVARMCAFSPDGRWLASGHLGHAICLWELGGAGGITLRHTLHHHTNLIQALLFSPDSRTLFSGGHDQTLCRWDVATGTCQASWSTHNTVYLALSFHPNGQHLVAGGADRTIRWLDSTSGAVRHTWRHHSHAVEALSLRSDGQLLASASQDETIRLWQVGNGTCLQTLYTPGPYAGMNITGVTGISAAQKAALKALGAVEE